MALVEVRVLMMYGEVGGDYGVGGDEGDDSDVWSGG